MAKSTKKRSLSTLLVVVLLAVVAIGGMLAYLTDEDAKQNVFTVGSIDIELDENVDVEGAGEAVKNEDGTGATYTGVMPGDKLIKEVIVQNTGESDAYVRVDVTLRNEAGTAAKLINSAIDDVYEDKYGKEYTQGMYDYIFDGWGINYNPRPGYEGTNNARGVMDDPAKFPEYVMDVDFTKTTDISADTFMFDKYNMFMSAKEKAAAANGSYSTSLAKDGYYAKELGNYEIRYTYYMELPAKKSTVLFDGLNVPTDFDEKQLAMFNGLIIDVEASAIQKANFDTAKAAFETLAAEENTTYVHTEKQLKDTLKAGGNVTLGDDVTVKSDGSNGYGKTGINIKNDQTVDGQGNTISVTGANGTWDSAVNMAGGTLKNATIDSGFRGVFVTTGEKVTLDNVIVDGPTYTISCDQASRKGLEAINCTFNGWTSYAATIGNVKFENCYFGRGAGYAFARPYAPTEFVGCDFEAGYEVDARAAVTFEDCTIGGVALTTDNLATLVTSNIANATVK